MADAFTTTSTLTQATTAYERLAYYDLRPELFFDACASIKPTRQSHPGSAVLFNIVTDLAPAVTPLSETADVDAVALSDTEVTISLNEYGNAVISSARIRGYSYLVVSEEVANAVGFNAGLSFDCLARNPLVAGTNVIYGGDAASRATLNTGDVLSAARIRQVVAQLTDASVQRLGNYYRAFLASSAGYDLRSETGAAAWRDPHTYSQPGEIWNGEIGVFEGAAFIETPRLTPANLETTQGGPGGFLNGGAAGGASGNFDVFPIIVLGNQALAKTWSKAVSQPMPAIILGAVTDKLQRFVPVGWYWLGGFGRFREAALRRIEVISSIVL